jgi:tetratricopeptide (TPR) repeat protein
MALKTEKDLSEHARGLWLKAKSAAELRNFGYAISLIQTVLKEAPEFLEGRKLLRRAELASTKGKKGFMGFSSSSMKGGGMVKKDPKAAMEMAEKSLETDPTNHGANMLLRDAALALGIPEIAAFALETIADANPKDTKILHELASHYSDYGDSEKAVEVYSRITEINPADLVALKKGKDAAARATLTGGGWEEVAKSGGTKDYRDLMKNKEEAISLEQKGRVVKSEEMIEQQLAELGEQYQANPQSVDIARKIAMLYEQKEDLENAVTWYKYTSELTKNTDPVIARKASDLEMKMLDNRIAEFENWLGQYGDAENAGEVRQQLEDLEKQKAEAHLNEARKRVERNPTDLQLRYELGEQLLKAGQPTEAIPELQQARRNPNARLKAMNLLGDCYVAKGMLDFAVRTYQETAKEMVAMDDVKKDVIYKLGMIFDKMGDKEKAIENLKQIYEVDYGYKDVAKRVEESYTG